MMVLGVRAGVLAEPMLLARVLLARVLAQSSLTERCIRSTSSAQCIYCRQRLQQHPRCMHVTKTCLVAQGPTTEAVHHTLNIDTLQLHQVYVPPPPHTHHMLWCIDYYVDFMCIMFMCLFQFQFQCALCVVVCFSVVCVDTV